MEDRKQYCYEGESDETKAIGVAILLVFFVCLPGWVLFLWAVGVINVSV